VSEIHEFLQAIRDRRDPLTSGADGLRGVEILEAAVASWEGDLTVRI
jgi:predicted dehydrogenase